MILLLAICAGVAMAAFLFKVFFDDLGDFLDCVRFCFTPDVVSLFRGEWGDDQWGESNCWSSWGFPLALFF